MREGAIPSEAVENRVYHNLIHPAGAAGEAVERRSVGREKSVNVHN